MTFHEWLSSATQYWTEEPEQRFGQALINSLIIHNKSVFDNLPRRLDVWEVKYPYADTELVLDFLHFVQDNW